MICGDEEGRVWAWDLVDVSAISLWIFGFSEILHRCYNRPWLLKLIACFLNLGKAFAIWYAPQGTREGYHMGRAPPASRWGNGYRKR